MERRERRIKTRDLRLRESFYRSRLTRHYVEVKHDIEFVEQWAAKYGWLRTRIQLKEYFVPIVKDPKERDRIASGCAEGDLECKKQYRAAQRATRIPYN